MRTRAACCIQFYTNNILQDTKTFFVSDNGNFLLIKNKPDPVLYIFKECYLMKVLKIKDIYRYQVDCAESGNSCRIRQKSIIFVCQQYQIPIRNNGSVTQNSDIIYFYKQQYVSLFYYKINKVFYDFQPVRSDIVIVSFILALSTMTLQSGAQPSGVMCPISSFLCI